MTEPASTQGIRVGTAERDAAIAALADHHRAGRLDVNEYNDRAAKASAARFSGELDQLFADLPQAPAAAASPAMAAAPAPHIGLSGREAFGGRTGATLVALSPFIALALFFGLAALGFGASWLAFLLVPIAGVIVYGSGGSSRGR